MRVRYSQDYDEGVIGSFQSLSMIVLNILGIGSLYLPSIIASNTGRSAIFSILLTGIFVWFLILLSTSIMQKFPRKSFVDVGVRLLSSSRHKKIGKWLFAPIFLFFITKWFSFTAFEISTFVYTLKIQYLSETPYWVLLIMTLLSVYYAAKQGPSTIARINLLLFPLAVLPLFLFVFGAIGSGNLINLVPALPNDWWSFLKGTVQGTVISFTGFTIFLAYMRFYQEPKSAHKYHSWGIWFVVFWYIFTYLACSSVFGPDEIENMATAPFHLVTLTGGVSMFLERLDPALLPSWMLLVFAATANKIFAITYSLKEYFRFKEEQRNVIILWASILLYCACLLPKNFDQIIMISEQLGIFYWIVFTILVLGAVLLTRIRFGKRREEKDDSASM